MITKSIQLRCDDDAETVVFRKYDKDGYEISIEDSYCGGDYMGIKGRFKRAWMAFKAKPIMYTAIFCEDTKRVEKFLKDCLDMLED